MHPRHAFASSTPQIPLSPPRRPRCRRALKRRCPSGNRTPILVGMKGLESVVRVTARKDNILEKFPKKVTRHAQNHASPPSPLQGPRIVEISKCRTRAQDLLVLPDPYQLGHLVRSADPIGRPDFSVYKPRPPGPSLVPRPLPAVRFPAAGNAAPAMLGVLPLPDLSTRIGDQCRRSQPRHTASTIAASAARAFASQHLRLAPFPVLRHRTTHTHPWSRCQRLRAPGGSRRRQYRRPVAPSVRPSPPPRPRAPRTAGPSHPSERHARSQACAPRPSPAAPAARSARSPCRAASPV